MRPPNPPPDPTSWCAPHPPETHPIPDDGRRHCGILETVLRRQWDPADKPPAELVATVDFLASLPGHLAWRLADWLEGLWVGDATVPSLDDLGHLAGRPVRAGSGATWDLVPGALVGRTLVIGTGDHVSASLPAHEVAHALERMDRMADRPEWQTIMVMCRGKLLADRYEDPYEWFAESWAMVATGQYGRLLRMVTGHKHLLTLVSHFHVRHYGLRR